MSLELGIAVHDITPPPGLPMGGYAARTGRAQRTLDALACRAAVLHNGAGTAVLLVVDLLYVRDPWAAATRERVARRLGIEPTTVMIAATHTHAGPAVFHAAMQQTDELADYERHLADVAEAVTDEAVRGMQTVTLHYGVAASEGVCANRQDRGGGMDPTVRAVIARSHDGRPAAVIASFGCHPTVLSAANLAYSRDLFGAAVDIVERELAAPVLLFNGAAGDISTRFTRQGQTPDELGRLGRRLATGMLDAVRNTHSIADGPIAGRTVDVPLELRRFPAAEEAQARVTDVAAHLEEARGQLAEAELRRLAVQLEGAMAQLYFSLHGGIEALLGTAPKRAMVQTLRLGGCDLLGVPGEMFSAVGRSLCERRPRPALLAGYANDYVGYLVPPGSADGYEALISFVTEESAAAIADALVGG